MNLDELKEQFPVSEDAINRLNILRDYALANTVETGVKLQRGGYSTLQRVWNDEQSKKTFMSMYDDFIGHVLATYSNRECVSILYTATNAKFGYLFDEQVFVYPLPNMLRASVRLMDEVRNLS